MFNMIDKEAHRKKRRTIGPVISERSMRIFEPNTLEQIDTFLLQILRSSQQGMTPPCEQLAVDIVGKLSFGYSLNTLVKPTHRGIVEGLKTRGKNSSLYFFWSDLRLLSGFLTRSRASTRLIASIDRSG